MSFSSRKYDQYLIVSLVLSLGLHGLLSFIPGSVKELFIGPPQLAIYASRFEVIPLAKEPAPRYVTGPVPAGAHSESKVVVPVDNSPRFRPTAADTAAGLLLSEPDLSAIEGIQEQFVEAASITSAERFEPDSTALVQAYISTVLDRVRDRRRYPEVARRLGQEGEVLLAFSINSQGLLQGEIELLNPCRYSLLNRSARRSIERSMPFPPLPAPVINDHLPVKIKLLYRLTD